MTKRLKMNVEFDVTISQALALQAFFNHWNRLASMGSSRMVSFYVDGDGNFKPKCNFSFSQNLPELTKELENAAMVSEIGKEPIAFDFDPIAWKLRKIFGDNYQEVLTQDWVDK